nr:uncharacterized protein LOC117685339 [Crassostrea gigas]
MRIALFLPVINILSIAKGDLDYPYRFDVHQVDKCPMNASEFGTAARRRNCSTHTRYLCAPDKYLSNLIEFCTDRRSSLFKDGNCLLLDGTGDLNHYRCEDKFIEGCPTKPFNDDEIYRYPACLRIDKDFKCFIADKECPSNIYTRNGTKTQSVDEHSTISADIMIIVGVFLSIVIVTAIIGFIFYKKLKIGKGQKKLQIDENKLRQFLSRKEMTVHHVRGIIVGCGGAGKTTLLKRLGNSKFKDIMNTKSTLLLDVHFNEFEVLEEEETIQRIGIKTNQTAIVISPNMLTNVTDHSEETYTRPDDLIKECGYNEDLE